VHRSFMAEIPMRGYFGTIMSLNPLKIYIKDGLTIGESSIILGYQSKRVLYGATLSIAPGGSSNYTTYDIAAGAQVGDKVLLIRQLGGKRYWLADKFASTEQ